MTVIIACVRALHTDENNGLGWRCEVITKFESTDKSHIVEFDDRRFILGRFVRDGTERGFWYRDDDNYHFNLCKTAKQLWHHVCDMVDYGHTKADRTLKWLRDEEQKVKDLKDTIRLLKAGGTEWSPIEEEN